MRFAVFALTIVLAGLSAALALARDPAWAWPLMVLAPLAALGVWDVIQPRHSVLRNYPVIGHLRWLFEAVRPELRQYFFASDEDDRPFDRQQRSLVYRRAKQVEDRTPFGTKDDAYDPDFSWLTHSVAPRPPADGSGFRVRVGGPACARPYDASVLNISAMSFGSLSANAIRALNRGAKLGGFAHDTGEGAISRHHRAEGGDLIWEIGTGYFGCRTAAGAFDPALFADTAAADQVRMVEIKISQGAKPGHGGVLPAAKITPEIAEARGIPMGVDCVSPAFHSAFSTPLELVAFIASLRELAGGKPVGFKLCIGHPHEFMAILKAMLKTDVTPDFIVIDGAEGGTGAAPIEFADHIGTPLAEGLAFAHSALVGAGLRDRVRLAASGKVVSAFDIVRVLALGADWANAARAFMFAIGCIQSLSCHTNHCPVGVATQDRRRQRGLVVSDKATRVANYHRNTLHALAEVIGAAGLTHPSQITREHVFRRQGDGAVVSAEHRFRWLHPGELIDGCDDPAFARAWSRAQPESFAPKED